MNDDLKNMKLLYTFHYVLGGITYLFSLFPIIHIVIGWTAIVSPEKMMGAGKNAPPPFFGWMFLIIGIVFVLLGLTLATLIIISGRKLSNLKNYWFSFIVACIECMFMPIGTILGVFTIIMLSKESVKTLYGIKSSTTS